MMKVRGWIAVVSVVTLASCLRFEPRPATKVSDYSESGVEESVTMRDEDVHFSPAVLAIGTPRDRVFAAFGHPNASRTTDAGTIEDVYAFNPDGSKFVNPTVRPRNLALAFFTAGISVAVRHARLALVENKLTLYHVLYTPNDDISSVTVERLPGAPERLPSA